MKVKGLLVAAVAAMMCFGAQNASAIEAPNHEGDFNLNVMGGCLTGYAKELGLGASVSGDYVLINSWWKGHFTVGGFVDYNTTKIADDDYWNVYYNNFSIMARATYGLNITDKFEVHAGAMSGPVFYSAKWKKEKDGSSWEPSDDKSTNFDGAFVAGCRYFFTDSFAVTSELIEGIEHHTLFNVGVSFKF